MEGLPYYCPNDRFGRRIEVTEPYTKGAQVRDRGLNLNRGHVREMSTYAAWREILQNLIDAVTEANGESFVGLKSKSGPNRGAKSVLCFYTDKHILGEIVESHKTISFSNFGPNVRSIESILQFGASEKHTKRNQGGKFGEGLKRAALKLLLKGFKVDLFLALTEDDETTFRHLIFKLNNNDELCYSMSYFKPTERYKGANDYHRFEVIVSGLADNAKSFDIGEYMLNNVALIRDVRDANDYGIILLNDHAGDVYVWHFYVENYDYMMFGYDLFLGDIARDRNNVNVDTLRKSIAGIWSYAIVEDAQLAKFFLDKVVMNQQTTEIMYEVAALRLISKQAIQVLLSMLDLKGRRPICKDDEDDLYPKYDESHFVVVPKHAEATFVRVLGPLDKYLDALSQSFRKMPSVKLETDAQSHLSDTFSLIVVGDMNLPLHYDYDEPTSILCLNARHVPVDPKTGNILDKDAFWNTLLFCVIPTIFRKRQFNGMQILKKLMSVSTKDSSTASSEEQQQEKKPAGSKRQRPEPVEFVPPQASLPPAGYKYYEGPRLLVKID